MNDGVDNDRSDNRKYEGLNGTEQRCTIPQSSIRYAYVMKRP